MVKHDYIIVGRDVGEAKYHLVGDNIIPATENPGGQPLDVIFIGKLIAKMSERTGKGRKATKKEKKLIRLCLRADSLPAGKLSKTEAKNIVDNTKIKVRFEKRKSSGRIDEDKNTRILVVPSDGTLKKGLDELQMPVVGKPFQPPLTYPVDENLMLSWMVDGIIEKVVNVESPSELDGMNWHQIRKHFADNIEAQLIQQAKEDKVSQIKAYHRAVGIYVTNMCR